MKCDELKPLVFSIADLAYVDEIRVTKNFQNPHDHAVYKATEVDAAIAELKEELSKQWDYHKRMEKCWLENDRINRRALWLAMAERAKGVWKYYAEFLVYVRETAMNKWKKVERLCRAKEDEYK